MRALVLVFSCMIVPSFAYMGLLNVNELARVSIPRALINSQELFVTISSEITLFFMGSYNREARERASTLEVVVGLV